MQNEYDKSKEIKECLIPKLKELENICVSFEIPYFVSFAVKDTDTSTQYLTKSLTPASKNVILNNDIFPRLINVTNGFETVAKKGIREIEIN